MKHKVGEFHFWPVSKESPWMFITKIVRVRPQGPNDKGPYLVDFWTGPKSGGRTLIRDGALTSESDLSLLTATPISKDKAESLLHMWGFSGEDLEL